MGISGKRTGQGPVLFFLAETWERVVHRIFHKELLVHTISRGKNNEVVLCAGHTAVDEFRRFGSAKNEKDIVRLKALKGMDGCEFDRPRIYVEVAFLALLELPYLGAGIVDSTALYGIDICSRRKGHVG